MMLGLSLAPGDIVVRRAAGGGASLLPQTEAWLAALTTAELDHPTAPHIAAVDTFYGSLISAGIYGSLDLLPCFFLESSDPADSEGVALMDLIALQQWSAVNGPTFTAGVGFTGDGVSATVRPPFILGSTGNYALASAHAGVFNWTGVFGTTFAFGFGSTGVTALRADNAVNRINRQFNSGVPAPAGNRSSLLIDRDGDNVAVFADGSATPVSTALAAPLGLPNTLGGLFQFTGNFWNTTEVGAFSAGAHLDVVGYVALHNAIQTLKAAVA